MCAVGPRGAGGAASALFLGTTLVTLGALSHMWWASGRATAQHYDNLMIESHLLALVIVLLSATAPALELLFVAAAAAISLGRVCVAPRVHEARLALPTTCLFWIGALSAAWRLGGCGEIVLFAGATALLLLGVVCKTADALGDGAVWGTAAFHYLEAGAFVGYFMWVQTLPYPHALR